MKMLKLLLKVDARVELPRNVVIKWEDRGESMIPESLLAPDRAEFDYANSPLTFIVASSDDSSTAASGDTSAIGGDDDIVRDDSVSLPSIHTTGPANTSSSSTTGILGRV